MKTITFYSYKGGAGRSLLLANLACFLARNGHKVMAVDLDLEAPGLHYKFGLHSRNQPNLRRFDKGLLAYLGSVTDGSMHGEQPSLGEHVFDVPLGIESKGSLWLLPAGSAPSPRYPTQLVSATQLFQSPDTFMQADIWNPLEMLKNEIRREYRPDYLLIDSRTGITNIGGVALNDLPNTVVVLMLNNDENLEGCRATLRGIKQVAEQSGGRMPTMLPVLTRVPFGPIESDPRTTLDSVLAYLHARPRNDEANVRLTPNDFSSVQLLHSQPDLQSFEEILVGGEQTLRESVLLRDYLQLFDRIAPNSVRNSEWAELYLLLRNSAFVARHQQWWFGEAATTTQRSPLTNVQQRQGDSSQATLVSLRVAPARFPVVLQRFEAAARLVTEKLSTNLGVSKPQYLSPDELNYDILGTQMQLGVIDVYEDAFYLSPERSLSDSVVQFGELSRFTCCVQRNTNLARILKQSPVAGGAQPGAFSARLRSAVKQVAPATIEAAVLGETAATSAAVRDLTSVATSVRVLADEAEIAKWITAPLLDGVTRMAVCDHVVFRRVQSSLERNGNAEALEPGLSFPFPRPYPVGFLCPKGAFSWRRKLVKAFADVVLELGPDNWRLISRELAEVGVTAFALDELRAYLLMDMPPDVAVSWDRELNARWSKA